MSDFPPEIQTLRDHLRYAVSEFNRNALVFGHGNDNAWDEAVYLLLHSLHLPAESLDTFLDARLSNEESRTYFQLVQRRIHERLPAAYLTGKTWLQGIEFFVDSRVIIPRSHIAELLSDSLSPWLNDTDEVTAVLDLCTGSGCLAILAALAFPDALVDAVDISADALDVARQNILHHQLTDRVHLYQGDLYAQLDADWQYDLIISNPPYVNTASMEALPPEYRHEPRLALAGGDDGMDLVRRILLLAPDYLRDKSFDSTEYSWTEGTSPESLLVLEIGNEYHHFCEAFPFLEPIWLETANSSHAVLLLTRSQLLHARSDLSKK